MMISHEFQPQSTTGHSGRPINIQHAGQSISTTFELREVALERTKKRLEKYRKTAERKEIDHEAFLDAKLLRDFKETKKYLAKVNDSKIRKNKSKDGKKEPPGVGGLSKDQTDMVQSKIREQIQAEINAKNRIKKKQSDKRLKGLTGTCFENRFESGPFGGSSGTSGPLDQSSGGPFQSSSEIQNPSISNPFSNDFIISEISDKDIQNVLGENVFPGNVKHEGEVTGSYSQPSQQSSVLSSTNLQPGLQSSNSEDYATMYNNYYNHQIQQIYNNAANYNTSATGGTGSAWTSDVQQSAGSVRGGPGGTTNGPVPGSYFGSSNSQNFQPSSQLHDFLSNQY